MRARRDATITACVCLLFFGVIAAEETGQGERFESTAAGIALNRPAGWNTASIQDVEANRERIRLPDEELQRGIQQYATTPLFVFTRYPEPHDELNPTIQVVLRPLGPLAGLVPVEIMSAAVEPLQEIFPGFEYIEEIHPTEVSGLKAARMSATYTIENDQGRSFDTLSKLWIVPRGSFMFMIGMSGPKQGSDDLVEIFETVIGTIEISE